MKSTPILLFAVTLCLLVQSARALEPRKEAITPVRLTEAVNIRIDGKLDEPVWETLTWYDDLVVIEPDTLAEVPYQTRIRFFYTEKGLYLGAWNQQPADTLVSRLSSRDLFISRDDVAFTLDPGGAGLYAYWFSVTLGGTLQDGTVLPERQYSTQWDGPWHGASAVHDEGWSAEFFLPWSMFSMPDGGGEIREMGYYISRFVAHRTERWAYPALPRTQPVFLSQLPKMQFDQIEPRQQFTFYPYGSVTYDNTRVGQEDAYKAGFDVFWRPSTNLQLTATVNPDFGNVESDSVVVNLTSFETFFPEKRAFFLEGNEIFDATSRARNSGMDGPTTMLHTRRIGGPPRYPDLPGFVVSDLEVNQPSELMGAAKLTGQNGRFRYGVLAAFEEDTLLTGTIGSMDQTFLQKGREFGVARVIYEDARGNARRSLGMMSTLTSHPDDDAIANGIDGRYLSADGRWNLEGQLLHSRVADTTGFGGYMDLAFTPAQGRQHSLAFDYYDDKLDINSLGFLRRNDNIGTRYRYERTESDLADLKLKLTEVTLVQDYNTAGRVVRSGAFLLREHQFLNNNFAFVELNYFPPRWEDINSNGNGSFRIKERFQTGLFGGTDESKKVRFFSGIFYTGEMLGGRSMVYILETDWRPSDRFSLGVDVRYEDKKGWLLHSFGRNFTTYESSFWRPKIEADFFLTARQQFRLVAQWAGIKAFEEERWEVPIGDGDLEPVFAAPGAGTRDFSISRLTFQARYRWEIAPLSDLFVVYTRGSNVASRPGEDFNELLKDSWTEPLVDLFVIKLRYRLGN